MINRAADFVHQDTGAGNGGACSECRADAADHPIGSVRAGADDDRSRGVSDVAITLGRHIELQEVPALQLSRPRHTVDDFVVDAEKHVTGKAVDEHWRGTGTVARKDPRSDSIKISGRYTCAHVCL